MELISLNEERYWRARGTAYKERGTEMILWNYTTGCLLKKSNDTFLVQTPNEMMR